MLNAAVAAAYYLRIVAVMYFRTPLATPRAEGGAGSVVGRRGLRPGIGRRRCISWTADASGGTGRQREDGGSPCKTANGLLPNHQSPKKGRRSSLPRDLEWRQQNGVRRPTTSTAPPALLLLMR